MAFVGIRVPKETCSLFSSIDVPGDKVDQSTMHITLLYLGKEVPLEQVAKAIEVTAKLCQETEHFDVSTSRAETFSENPDDGFPVIARIESDALHSFQKSLKQAYDNANVEYSKKYPVYKPHVTLAYDKKALESPIKFPKITFGVHELTLWGGDNNEELVSANFPFKMQQPKAAAYKLLEAASKMDPKKRALAIRLVKAAEQVLLAGEGESPGAQKAYNVVEQIAQGDQYKEIDLWSPDVKKAIAAVFKQRFKQIIAHVETAAKVSPAEAEEALIAWFEDSNNAPGGLFDRDSASDEILDVLVNIF